MTLKDLLQSAVALLVLVGMYANVRVSMALRERDRKDFEELRDDHNDLRNDHSKLEGRVGVLEERTK